MEQDKVKANGSYIMKCCLITSAVSIIIAIIVIMNNEWSEVAGVIFAIGILLVTCIFGTISGYRKYKHPEKYSLVGGNNKVEFRNIKFWDSSYVWDSACKIYCEQYNKKVEELNETDESMIWRYCDNGIAYLVMWLVENDYFVIGDWESGEELIRQVKRREETPDELIESIDCKITEEDITENIGDFFMYYYEGEYFDDYKKFVEDKLDIKIDNADDVYRIAFEWADYDRFKPLIEKAYEKYNSNQNL